MHQKPSHIQSTKRTVGKQSIPLGWDGALRSGSALFGFPFPPGRYAIQVAPRFALRHEKRALCGTLNAISNLPSRKVLLSFLIFNSSTVLTRVNYQLSIINYQLMKKPISIAVPTILTRNIGKL